MPHTKAQQATVWKTDEIMTAFEKFVQAASEITDILERAPEI